MKCSFCKIDFQCSLLAYKDDCESRRECVCLKCWVESLARNRVASILKCQRIHKLCFPNDPHDARYYITIESL